MSAAPTALDTAAIERYQRQGWLSPFRAFDAAQARDYRRLLEEGESRHGSSPDLKRKMHLYLRWVDEIIRVPQILDPVESLIGPDILVYTITLWLKEPRSETFVSWHQDSTYFGLEPADQHISAWVALSPSTAERTSGTDFSWKILQSLVSVVNHSPGTTSSRQRVSSSSRPTQLNRLT